MKKAFRQNYRKKAFPPRFSALLCITHCWSICPEWPDRLIGIETLASFYHWLLMIINCLRPAQRTRLRIGNIISQPIIRLLQRMTWITALRQIKKKQTNKQLCRLRFVSNLVRLVYLRFELLSLNRRSSNELAHMSNKVDFRWKMNPK